MSHDALGRVSAAAPFSTLPLATMALSLDGELLEVNGALCHLLDRQREDLVGAQLDSLSRFPTEVDTAQQSLTAARRGTPNGDFRQEWLNVGSGVVAHVRVAWTLALDDLGEPAGLTAVCVDETRQVLAERRAASSEARFEQSGVPQTSLDLRGRVVDANRAFCKLVGLGPDQLMGRSLTELGHRIDDGDADELAKQLLAGDADSIQVEQVLQLPDGRPIHVLADATTLRNSAGEATGVAIHLHDLTAMRDVERRRQQQEDFFLALSQRASDLAVVIDSIGQIMYVSPALGSVTGHNAEDVLGADGTSYIHPEDAASMRGLMGRVMNGWDGTITLRIRDAMGTWRWFEATLSNLLHTAVGGVVCNLRDITERLEAERALRASEARYRAIADSADEGLWVATADGRTLYANSRLCEILGIEPDEIYDQSVADLFVGVPREMMRLRLAQRHARGAERYETTYLHPDGGERILRFAAAPLDVGDAETDQPTALAMVTDITESRRLELELSRSVLHDSLTGLPNRALLLDRLEHALTRDTGTTAVLFVDLDQFKIINDARGHTVGDELLVTVAERLSVSARPADTVARFGGDEFLVICEKIDEAQAHRIATELLTALDEPFTVGGDTLHVAASIGIALSPAPTAEHLLRNAETAMYAAKNAGRRGVRVFDASLAEQARELFELGGELRAALARDELVMHYQPIIDLETGRVVGVEALARWDHPTLGSIPPDRFVALAENTGLSPELDRWALRRGLCGARDLRASGALARETYVAVNLSGRNLADPGLEEHIAACAQTAGLAPHDVVLEITERAIMADHEPAVALLGRLREQGFQVAMDDFGTGHSSLSLLHALPISTLKIDRSFVADISSGDNALAITTSIVELARAVGVTVVAEGVETAEHARLLRELGCATGQGWLWSAAVSPEDAVRTGALVRTYDMGASAAGD